MRALHKFAVRGARAPCQHRRCAVCRGESWGDKLRETWRSMQYENWAPKSARAWRLRQYPSEANARAQQGADPLLPAVQHS